MFHTHAAPFSASSAAGSSDESQLGWRSSNAKSSPSPHPPYPAAAPAAGRVRGAVGAAGGAADDIGVEARQCCVVEMDMGRLTLARFRRKVRAFEVALESGLFARERGRDEFEVLVLVRTEGRLRHLVRAARAEVTADRRGWYSFATVDALDPSRFGGAVWTTLEGDELGLLYDWDGEPELGGAERDGEGGPDRWPD